MSMTTRAKRKDLRAQTLRAIARMAHASLRARVRRTSPLRATLPAHCRNLVLA
ncbi:hypothetical protein FA09DRAFT_327799 [Tilletiopsis washingtonensis]|jgi:hypothetical protein|uniref:Uncharacterized protein n=1 Tax=Tilletiopsis washingtonensis TaxID=58919 RepID=A0A316ZH34_9BASI|nr:hypothetical protein FA09DRAFT_327799 [Tilletiopsis washingtonensis]PWO00345.1 hypothetical protein FA09DRAFT_327799 [Tilletiopsis washingtonensis]